MDTSKLTVKLPVDTFYDTYVETVRNLYDTSFIAQNHLEPATKSSFQRVMSKRAGISLDEREDTKQYTKADLDAIVTDTNLKYEEYLKGSYSDSTKARGEARYRLLSTVLKETFLRLGYDDLAEKFIYAENSKDTVEENVNEAYKTALVAEQEEEDSTVKKNVEMLKGSLETVKQKIKEFSSKELSDKDREVLQKLHNSLKDTIDSAAKVAEGKSNVQELTDLIKQGEECIVQIQDMLSEEKVQNILSRKDTQTVKEDKDVDNILSMLPKFIEGVKTVVQKNEELLQQINALKTEVETVKQQTVLPDNDDALIGFIKDAINAVQDNKRLKDIGMLILMKTM